MWAQHIHSNAYRPTEIVRSSSKSNEAEVTDQSAWRKLICVTTAPVKFEEKHLSLCCPTARIQVDVRCCQLLSSLSSSQQLLRLISCYYVLEFDVVAFMHYWLLCIFEFDSLLAIINFHNIQHYDSNRYHQHARTSLRMQNRIYPSLISLACL